MAIKCRYCGEWIQGEENAGSEIVYETSSEKSNKEHKSKIVKKRRPILALLLSFLTPGLGQIYNGQAKRGIVLYSAVLLLAILLSFTDLYLNFHGLILSLAVLVGFSLFVMLDALYNAIKLKEVTIKKYNQWYFYLIIILLQSFLITPLTKAVLPLKAYKIPASSMEPTLLVGDHIIIDNKYYKDKKPERWGLIVFRTLWTLPWISSNALLGSPENRLKL